MDSTIVEMNKLSVTIAKKEPRDSEIVEINKLATTVTLEED